MSKTFISRSPLSRQHWPLHSILERLVEAYCFQDLEHVEPNPVTAGISATLFGP